MEEYNGILTNESMDTTLIKKMESFNDENKKELEEYIDFLALKESLDMDKKER